MNVTLANFSSVYQYHAGGYFRAPGTHQYTFALECHTDLLVRALGMDPAEFRRWNLVGPGEEDAVGRPLRVAPVQHK